MRIVNGQDLAANSKNDVMQTKYRISINLE